MAVIDPAPALDPLTAPSWLRWFNQLYATVKGILTGATLANTTLTSATLTDPSISGAPSIASGATLKFLNQATDPNDGKIANAVFAPGLNIVGINNDGAGRKVTLWGGITQQQTNAAGNTWLGANAFASPDLIAFGANWQGWTPSYSGSGSMSVASPTLYAAQYLRVGPLIFFVLYASLTVGGTLSNTIYASLPTTGGPSAQANCSVQINTNTTPWSAGTATAYPDSGRVSILLNGLANYPAGAVYFQVSGFYRAA